MKEKFKIIISDFIERELPDVINRTLEIPLESKKIITLVGSRRTGKTYFFFSLIKKIRQKVNKSLVLYINFEDDRLFPIKLEYLNVLIEAYYELFPLNREKTVYFFFDEIQNVPNWEKFVRRIYDTLNCKIYLTGSSSKFLSKEIATSLRGRTISYEVFPFSFYEFLEYRKIDKNYLISSNRSQIINAFDYYLYNSTYPELLEAGEFEKQSILKEYLDLIIFRDLVERYNVSNLFLIRYLIKFLMSNVSDSISITKIYNDLKSQAIKVAKNSLFQYIEYFEDAYIFFPLKIFSNNLREVQRNPQKIYVVDNGLVDIVSLGRNIGRRFENLVYLELRRRNNNLFYFKAKQEIDFCLMFGDEIQLINASYSLEEKKTKEREISSLVEGMTYFNIGKSFLITNTVEEQIKIDKKTVFIVPFWKWILDK
ncbi:MAG: ATP-binding protein [Ignavibacteria bacterium]|jgi:predicted AAA+ superfamily ATPase